MVRISGERCLDGASECEEIGSARPKPKKKYGGRKTMEREKKVGLRICLLKLDEEVEAAGVH